MFRPDPEILPSVAEPCYSKAQRRGMCGVVPKQRGGGESEAAWVWHQWRLTVLKRSPGPCHLKQVFQILSILKLSLKYSKHRM